MKKVVVIFFLLVFSATQFASILSDIGAPILHAICYGKVFKRRSTGAGDQIITMDSATFRRAQTDDFEIRIGGELFDIVSLATTGGGVQLQLTRDEFETHFSNIVHQIREALKKSSVPHHHGKHLQSWLLKLYLPDQATGNWVLPPSGSVVHILSLTPGLQVGIHNRYVQPPDLFI
jgi:hypothetical protein